MKIIQEKKGLKSLKKILMEIRCISYEQAIYILEYYGENNAEAILKSMIYGNIMYQKGEHGICATPNDSYDSQTILALWYLLSKIENIDLNEIFRTQEPSSIFFLEDNKMNEIVVIYDGREDSTLYRLNANALGTGDITYHLVVERAEQLDVIYNLINEQYPELKVEYVLNNGYFEGTTIPNLQVLTRAE